MQLIEFGKLGRLKIRCPQKIGYRQRFRRQPLRTSRCLWTESGQSTMNYGRLAKKMRRSKSFNWNDVLGVKQSMADSNATTIQILCIISIVFEGCILFRELTKRYHGETSFQSQTLKWFSLLPMVWGIVFFIFWFLNNCHLCGTYHFDGDIGVEIVFLFHPLFVGLYQLLRLYHLFAHNDAMRGYHISVFIFMVIWGVVVLGGYRLFPCVPNDFYSVVYRTY